MATPFRGCLFFNMKRETPIIIRNAGILQGSNLVEADILLADGSIMQIGVSLDVTADSIEFNAQNLLATYGAADVHVHLRVPGNPEKESMTTGTMAAAAGGFTTVCAMPNLNPAPDSIEHLQTQLDIIAREALVDVRPYATITVERKGRQITDIESLAPLCCGFSDDGSGVQDDGIMREAMSRVAAADSILAAHCEVNNLLRNGYIHDGEYARLHNHRGICSESEWKQIERDLKLAADTGCRYHVCHISTRESVEIIRDAKQDGVSVTCETGPHYLTFTDMDLKEEGRFKMNPPLRSAADREALLAGIADGTIDVLATDHAPHTAEEKGRGLERSLMGVTGLETAFGASYTALVKSGLIPVEKLVDLMVSAPRRIFRLGGELKAGERGDLVLFDLNKEWEVDSTRFLSMGKASPFDGMTLTGLPVATFRNAELLYSRLPLPEGIAPIIRK